MGDYNEWVLWTDSRWYYFAKILETIRGGFPDAEEHYLDRLLHGTNWITKGDDSKDLNDCDKRRERSNVRWIKEQDHAGNVRTVRAYDAKPPAQGDIVFNGIWVGGLNPVWDPAYVHQYFSQFGRIIKWKCLQPPDGTLDTQDRPLLNIGWCTMIYETNAKIDHLLNTEDHRMFIGKRSYRVYPKPLREVIYPAQRQVYNPADPYSPDNPDKGAGKGSKGEKGARGKGKGKGGEDSPRPPPPVPKWQSKTAHIETRFNKGHRDPNPKFKQEWTSQNAALINFYKEMTECTFKKMSPLTWKGYMPTNAYYYKSWDNLLELEEIKLTFWMSYYARIKKAYYIYKNVLSTDSSLKGDDPSLDETKQKAIEGAFKNIDEFRKLIIPRDYSTAQGKFIRDIPQSTINEGFQYVKRITGKDFRDFQQESYA